MRAAWIVGRAILVLVALGVLFITPLYSDGPGGRTYLTIGIIVDALAIIVLGAVAWSFFRDRTTAAR